MEKTNVQGIGCYALSVLRERADFYRIVKAKEKM
jgi:hypothetical protein